MWEIPDSIFDYLRDREKNISEYAGYTFNLIDKASEYTYEPMIFDYYDLISPAKVRIKV